MIPASNVVQVNPGVLAAGGSSLSLNGLILSANTLIPTDSVQSFASAAAVSDFFGPSSTEYALAQNYFAGFDTSTIKPGAILFAPYVSTARAAWNQSGDLSTMTLAQLQALASGTLILTVDGVVKTSGTIALGAIASFTAAATAIAAGFSGTPLTCVWNAVLGVFTLTSVTTGDTSTITFATGTLATGLKFTSATGATISQGSAVDTPTSAMDNAVAASQNWVLFTSVFEPSLSDKELFGVWVSLQNSRYGYVAWDTDAQAIVQNSTTCFGYVSRALAYNTVLSVYNTAALAVFVLGMVASIDFARPNGRISGAFKTQAGFTPTVTDEQIAANLIANGYSYYGTYADVNDQFSFLYDGKVSGEWEWLDTFVDQVYINAQFRSVLIGLLTSANSIPYNEAGYSLVRAALQGPINDGLSFGSIRTGVTLSQLQRAQVNQAAGRDVADTIQLQGYYLQVLDPGATVRNERGSPIVNFWYTDGGSVQSITMSSIDIL